MVKNNLIKNRFRYAEEDMDDLCGIRISGKGRDVVIFVVYAPTVSSKLIEERKKFFKEVEERIRRVTNEHDDIIVLGDFNAKLKYKREGSEGVEQSEENDNTNLMKGMIENLNLYDNYENEDSELYFTYEKKAGEKGVQVNIRLCL